MQRVALISTGLPRTMAESGSRATTISQHPARGACEDEGFLTAGAMARPSIADESARTKVGPNRERTIRKTLTFVPELERTISHRFNIALVGTGATSFATMVCESAFARAYKPSSVTSARQSAAWSASHEASVIDEQAPQPLCKTNSNGSTNHNDDPFVLFCPVGDSRTSNEVARLRFQPIEQFSHPLPSGAQDASNQAVAFLFWRIHDNGADTSSTDHSISEFTSRMVEVKYTSLLQRPYTSVLAFEAVDTQSHKLQTFVDKQSSVDVRLHMYRDDAEDTVFAALQSIVEEMIEFQGHRAAFFEHSHLDATKRPKSRSCVMQ